MILMGELMEGALIKWDIFFSEQPVAKFVFSAKFSKHVDNAC